MNKAKHLAMLYLHTNQQHTNVGHCLWTDKALLHKDDLDLPYKFCILCPNIWHVSETCL
jgi:hypothetical protein